MDFETLSQAKNYTNSQRLAHTETNTLTFDGNIEGKETLVIAEKDDGSYMRYVKVSDTPIDLTQVNLVRIGLYVKQYGKEFVQDLDMAKVGTEAAPDVGMTAAGTADYEGMEDFDNTGLIMSFERDMTSTDENGNEVVMMSRGVWFAEILNNGIRRFIASLTVETVHQIDPKFIPLGGGFPVVTITTSAQMGGQVELTEYESAQLDAASTTGLPCVVRYCADVAAAGIAPCIVDSDGSGLCTVPMYGIRTTENSAPNILYLQLERAAGAENWTLALGHWTTYEF